MRGGTIRTAPRLPAQTGAVTISSGGTYVLNVLTTTSGSPAVDITTSAAVTIRDSVIQHAGVGIRNFNTVGGITVKRTKFTAVTPSPANSEQQAINAWEPAALTVRNCSLVSGHGIQVSTGAFNSVQSAINISYNNWINVGRLSQPGVYQGAIHFDKVTAPDGKILWNRVTNTYTQTWGEDEIAMANSQGTSGHPIEIAHCMVNGIYPLSGNGSTFTGGAFDLADIAGGYITCHHCYALNYVNNGFMQPTNAPGVAIDNCVSIYDGIATDGSTTVSTPYGQGITVKNLYDLTGSQCVVTNCRVGLRRWNGTAFETANYQWENQGTQDGGGNTTLTANSTNKAAMVAEFEASVSSAGVYIGV